MTASTRFQRLFGKILATTLHLPPPTCAYVVHRGLRTPMRDGVDLIADHYEPLTARPAGTILLRGPYGRGGPFALLHAAVYAARGYHVVFQSVRGTYGSAGDFTPFADEIDDGADTAAWLREQPWFTGSFATVGPSYLGYTQWALLADPPPEMAAAVITVAPHDSAEATWGTGSFALGDFLGWSDLVGRQEDKTSLATVARQLRSRRLLRDATSRLPLGASGRTLLDSGAPWWESWVDNPASSEPFWDNRRSTVALERTQIPVLLVGGWQDAFLEQTMTQYQQLRRRGVPTALTIGSWTHSHFNGRALPVLIRETLDWLGAHLAGGPATSRSPVRIHVGGHGWIELAEWPPSMPEQTLFLAAGGGLSGTEAGEPDSSSFRYDPADPTPSVGGRVLDIASGVRDDSRLAQRDDVLTFTGEPLPGDLNVIGVPVVELAHTCDIVHHDIFVRISEVDSKGRSRNVTDGFRRFTDRRTDPGAPATVRLELDPTAHRFRAGSRIRVTLAGGSHPRFARNLGTGEPASTATRMEIATHTVHLGAGGGSRLLLPAGERLPSAD